MLAIRLRRMGAKKRPFFRIVVADATSARDGRFVEVLGHYDPRAVPERVKLNYDRLAYWLASGAQPSDTVRTLVARHPAPPASPEGPITADMTAPATESTVAPNAAPASEAPPAEGASES